MESTRTLSQPQVHIFDRRAVLRSLDQRIGSQIREIYQKVAVLEHQQAAGALGALPAPPSPKPKKKKARKKKGAVPASGEGEEESDTSG